LESVTVKPTRKRMQGGAGGPGGLAGLPLQFPYNFLKCSNLAPMFLKSNKH
jgi:hypothetical protein